MTTADLIPAELIPAIQAAAEEEHRSAQELVGDAIERYLAERRFYSRDEVHAKIAAGLKSLRDGKAIDGEAAMAELLAELDGPAARR
jgi:predicted transcriptional regulator